MVAYGILQDALEQHWQFFCRLAAIFFSQLEHRVLNDVQGSVIVAHGKYRVFKCAALNVAEKLA